MKRTITITALVALATIVVMLIFNKLASGKAESNVLTTAAKGEFEISISTAGELLAENSIDIKAPEIARRGRNIRAQALEIQDIIPEGTEVKEGDYVAMLNRTQYDNTLKDELERLTQARTNVEMRKLDTAVTLTGLRDEIRNQRHTAEEAQITLLNSKYEPPTIIRQAEIDLDRQQRILEQRERSYQLRVAQAERDLRTQKLNLERIEKMVSDLQEVLAGFEIKAPADGMVIYKKDRRGVKIKAGSSVDPFERVVATLPDLSSMLTKIFISEIEISKIRPGLPVEIAVDAFPEKTFTGKVVTIANIGETLPNSDSKVFEVMIRIDGSDPTLRPTMTTSNKVIISKVQDVVYIPAECVNTGSDGIPFVYKKNGTRQVVVPGDANDKFVIIEKGLEPGEEVYIIQPPDGDKFRMVGVESAELTHS